MRLCSLFYSQYYYYKRTLPGGPLAPFGRNRGGCTVPTIATPPTSPSWSQSGPPSPHWPLALHN
ncbi:hypothetical protein COLO4_16696 [Corchorus olitorius]|uniref:Uncharacterized protein n=1 Tax=Corchorus olitorius TaxID=93759 RepID=A0A1R3JG00_9ROSI|nr:hypothetical protein COLO4_16696 [Corchorus olitorius]